MCSLEDVIVQKAPHSSISDLDKHKFLVPYEVTVAQFIWILRQRLKLDPRKAIYLFVNRTLPQSSALMGEIYYQCQEDDGFLYVIFSGENTFGF
ncbi:hypothetical protein B4U80_09264 [Leptotrombidium deliense]|uniref:Gamma-aminobutyric acid receptor-associated protein-like 2 n=1 Tax=Leptotrombidium deliense TaxID=299467 RepID=A0A443SNZ7_9ACAR|nr:hypothetical protein B4U80_09264 [Leptotrombidium deliense]